MSDAVRSYSPRRGNVYSGTRRGGCGVWFILLLILGGGIWAFWTTRDTHPVERVIPANQTYHVQVRDLLSTRHEIAESPIWGTGIVPDNYADIPTWIGNSFGYPDWVLNNLVSDVCYVSGTDLVTFDDLLVVTRMSRIGCLLERGHRFLEGIEDEYAGGLALRKLSGVDFYYAVRGRTLVFSPSRDAIIRALTLRESDAIESLETVGFDVSGDLRGRILFSADEPLGAFFQRADCQLDVTPSSITFSTASVLKPDWRAPLDALQMPAPSTAMDIPAGGGAVVAGEFGVPLAQVWRAIDGIAGGALNAGVGQFGLLDQLTAPEREAALEVLTAWADGLGTGFALRTAGFDGRGMAPMPVLALMLTPEPGLLEGVTTLAGGSDASAIPEPGIPYRVEDSEILRFPLGWGAIVEPGAYRDGTRLFAVAHPEHIGMLQDGDNTLAQPTSPAHLYGRLRPHELVTLYQECATFYAENGLLRDQGPETIAAQAAELEAIAARVAEVRVLAGYENGAITIDLHVALTPAT